MKIYSVGGFVRDTLLGVTPKDRDYVVVGATEQEMLDLGYTKVGADFPVFLKDGEEYALARRERKSGTGYHGFEVVFDPTVTLEEDLVRRDLSINSMAMDLDGTIIDPCGGQRDLKARVLRHTSSAFADDPVRVLRTARFAARYDEFVVDPNTIKLMSDIVHELDYVPQERIWAEFRKGLMENTPIEMINVLEQCGAFNTKALRSYKGCYRSYLSRVQPSTPLYVRAAWLMTEDAWARDDLYSSHCIPTEISTVSKAFNRHVAGIMHYDVEPARDRLQLLYDFRVFSNSTLLDRCVEMTALMTQTTWLKSSIDRIYHDIELLNAKVDVQSIVAQCGNDGCKIKSALFDARLSVMSE